MKNKTVILLLLVLIITTIPLNQGQSKNSIYIYKTPTCDYEEFYKNNKNFVSFGNIIFSVQRNYLILTNRFYIPMKKIRLKRGEYLLAKGSKFLYLFNKNIGKFYIYSKKRIKFLKKYKPLDASSFYIYNDKKYFLVRDKIIVLDKEDKEKIMYLDEDFNSLKIYNNKIFLLNKKKLTILNLNGEREKELKDKFMDFVSFDVNFDGNIYLLRSDEILIYTPNLELKKKIKLDDKGNEIFFDISRALIVYFKNSGLKVLPPQISYKVVKDLNHPSDITIDEEKNIYILSSKDSKVLVYNKNLEFQYSFGENLLKHPNGIYYSNGKIYVSDSWNNKVRIFNKKGELILSFGNFGDEDNELCYPTRIKVYNNKIFVVDTYNHKVKVFDEHGKFLCSYGSDPFFSLISLFEKRNMLLEPIEVFVKNSEVNVVDGMSYKLIKFGKKIKRLNLHDRIVKVLNYKDKTYLLGSRWKYIYTLKEDELIPVFSLINNYDKSREFNFPYSFFIDSNTIFILDRMNSKLYKIEGVP